MTTTIMNQFPSILGLGLALGLGACGGGDDGGDGDAANTDGTTMTADDDGSAGDTAPMTMTTDPTTGNTSMPPADTGEDTLDDTGEDTGEPAGYDFDDTAPEDMTQIDRMGMPAINTAVISSKDDYNASSPVDDAAGVFVDEIVASLEGLHAALDDDLQAAELIPCAVKQCVGQAAPLVVPDVLRIDPSMPAGFPNGRTLPDPVIDVTLAVVLLDLQAEGQTAASLVGLNPTENDVPFEDDFPWLAPPH